MEPAPHPKVRSPLDLRLRLLRRENGRTDRDTAEMGADLLCGVDRGRILGFTGISAASADVARFLFYIFVVIFLVLLILGLTIFRV